MLAGDLEKGGPLPAVRKADATGGCPPARAIFPVSPAARLCGGLSTAMAEAGLPSVLTYYPKVAYVGPGTNTGEATNATLKALSLCSDKNPVSRLGLRLDDAKAAKVCFRPRPGRRVVGLVAFWGKKALPAVRREWRCGISAPSESANIQDPGKEAGGGVKSRPCFQQARASRWRVCIEYFTTISRAKPSPELQTSIG